MTIRFTGIRRVTHEEGRRRDRLFWASKSIEERVIAGWELAGDELLLRKEDEPKERTGWTLRRVRRRGR